MIYRLWWFIKIYIRYRLTLAAPTCVLWEPTPSYEWKFIFGKITLYKAEKRFNVMYALTGKKWIEESIFNNLYMDYSDMKYKKELVKFYIHDQPKIRIRDNINNNILDIELKLYAQAIRLDKNVIDSDSKIKNIVIEEMSRNLSYHILKHAEVYNEKFNPVDNLFPLSYSNRV